MNGRKSHSRNLCAVRAPVPRPRLCSLARLRERRDHTRTLAWHDRRTTAALQRAVAALTLVLFVGVSAGWADSARQIVQQGNRLYAEGQYAEAAERYEEALTAQPKAVVPNFNKANAQYRLDTLDEAMALYQQVAAESKAPSLVAKAKYNLGNCLFQRGLQQRQSDPQKALADLKTSVGYWRQVRDLQPQNEKAARNMELAKRTILEILEQLQQQPQPQDPNQPRDPNETQDPNQPPRPQDPNEPQDPNQPQQPPPQDPNEPQDPNDLQQSQSQSQDPNDAQEPPPSQDQGQEQEEVMAPDATAQEILDREKRLKKEREIRLRGRYQEVEKDW